MNYLTLEHITKIHGEKVLFEDLSIMINQGDKAAIVARNGSGKSSLMRIIAGEDSSDGDKASVYLNKDVRVGYLGQDPDFDHEDTILDAVLSSESEAMEPLKALYRAQNTHDPKEIEKALHQMDEHHAWEMDTTMRELFGKFQLPGFDFKVKHLSGGQKKRLALVRLLSVKPDFLILDEPTNHLDLEMIEWLERFLEQSQITLFMVTHDRYFLNNVCNQIYELDRGILYKYQGDYEDFLEKKSIRMQQESIYKDKTEKLLRKELDWVRRMPKARTTKNKARVDRFYDLKESLDGPKEQGTIEFEIDQPRLGSKVLELHHVTKSFGEKKIIDGFTYKFRPTDRVGIIGPNGSGKTSFIKLITGNLKSDQGKIIIGETVQFGHYEQDGLQVRDDKRVIDVIRDIADYIPLKKGHKLSAEGLLERFLFPRPQQQVLVSQLSGGEKRRLYLLTVLISNPNFLILDEPTNDLDIITLNVLEDYLLEFPGCIVIVSHDRYFMDKIVQHVFVLNTDGKIQDYPGNYSDYRASLLNQPKVTSNSEKENPQIKDKGKEKKQGFNEKREMNQIEKDLEKLSKERELLVAKFSDSTMDNQEISVINKRLTEIQDLLDQKELRWMELVDASS
ncbi:MAG: ABC-F family ATP-binding cassette domain-containing protein [Saprospiraceae bacterium]|nr:ABC-F family ATP-binding cassette domain-containing protein [Saprospiraceae bacterium]MBK8483037.1 ABC-F family ATP-binding cassette domain-containing protein [Saprospiraceae bacterium]MBK9729604.1 ABC-F family ATP-binding cassette domain-containing protein [Saprospiraceae bacterium]